MTPSNPTDLFLINHQFKTKLMVDTVAQIKAGLKSNKIRLSEGAILDLATCIWNDSLDLLQQGREIDEPTFIIDDDDGEIEIG
ncbi:MAG: hypothetical protein KME47_09915 [Nodosilinea sp. WJT8-NPBG4]|jgi:hypothetical protein|nr:hypothetical protein [Nodosilinea sp. WJT8-NPBG4]